MISNLKTEEELLVMDNKELLVYYQVLREHRESLLQYAKDFFVVVKAIRLLLKHRIDELEFDELVAEENRKNIDDYWNYAQTTIN